MHRDLAYKTPGSETITIQTHSTLYGMLISTPYLTYSQGSNLQTDPDLPKHDVLQPPSQHFAGNVSAPNLPQYLSQVFMSIPTTMSVPAHTYFLSYYPFEIVAITTHTWSFSHLPYGRVHTKRSIRIKPVHFSLLNPEQRPSVNTALVLLFKSECWQYFSPKLLL